MQHGFSRSTRERLARPFEGLHRLDGRDRPGALVLEATQVVPLLSPVAAESLPYAELSVVESSVQPSHGSLSNVEPSLLPSNVKPSVLL